MRTGTRARPIAFADGDKVRQILDASGWTEIEVGALDVASSGAEKNLFAYVTKLGPAGLALRDADEATRDHLVEALRAGYQPFVENGAARFTAASWLVTARA